LDPAAGEADVFPRDITRRLLPPPRHMATALVPSAMFWFAIGETAEIFHHRRATVVIVPMNTAAGCCARR